MSIEKKMKSLLGKLKLIKPKVRLKRPQVVIAVVILLSLILTNIIIPLKNNRKVSAATNIWDMGTAGDYTYDSSKIEVSGGIAQAKFQNNTGTGIDGAISIADGTKSIDSEVIASGRIYPDAVNYNVSSSLSAGVNTINIGATPNGLAVNDEILLINLRDPNNTNATTYGYKVQNTATSGAATTLTDTAQNWTTNAFIGMIVVISSGTGQGQSRYISSNTNDTITVSSSWTTNPAAASQYKILDQYALNPISDSGPVTSSSSSSISDGTKSWATNQFVNFSIYIYSGTGISQIRTIASNTATTITVSSSWTTLPDTTSLYKIINTSLWSTSSVNVGKYETHTITAINGTTLTLDSALTNAYNGTVYKVMLQRIAQYTDVTIGDGSGASGSAVLSVNGYDNTTGKGGVLFFRASGTVTINSDGKIDASEKGFAGGAPVTVSGE